jgi:hypothetical protein
LFASLDRDLQWRFFIEKEAEMLTGIVLILALIIAALVIRVLYSAIKILSYRSPDNRGFPYSRKRRKK